MSVIFLPVVLGLELAVPVLCAPGIFWFFLLLNPHTIPRYGGGGLGFSLERGGGSAIFIFIGVGIFPNKIYVCNDFLAYGPLVTSEKFVRFLTFFCADFGKEFPSRTFWRHPS